MKKMFVTLVVIVLCSIGCVSRQVEQVTSKQPTKIENVSGSPRTVLAVPAKVSPKLGFIK